VAPNASPLTKPGAQRLRAQRRRLKLSGIGSYVAAARMAELIRRYGLVWYEGISRARLDAYAGSLVVMRRSWSMGKGPAPFRSRTVATHVTELISLNGQYALRYQGKLPVDLATTDHPMVADVAMRPPSLGGDMVLHRHPLTPTTSAYLYDWPPRCPDGCSK
jgi:hypothetical protein